MKTYERLKQIKPAEFKRLVGVKKETFEVMLEVYSEYHQKKKEQGGRPNRLLPETQLLLMLEYYSVKIGDIRTVNRNMSGHCIGTYLDSKSLDIRTLFAKVRYVRTA